MNNTAKPNFTGQNKQKQVRNGKSKKPQNDSVPTTSNSANNSLSSSSSEVNSLGDPELLLQKLILQMTQWKNHELWLQEQLKDYKAEIARKQAQTKEIKQETFENKTNEPPNSPENKKKAQSEEDEFCQKIEEKIVKLQNQLHQLSTQKLASELLINKLQQTPESLYSIFAKEPGFEEEQVKTISAIRDQKSADLLSILKTVQEKQEEYEEVLEESSLLRKENTELFQQLKILQPIDNELQQGKIQNKIITQIFQYLVLKSGINWATDQQLRKIFLSQENEN